MTISPFHVAVPEQVLLDLRERIQRTRWPDEIPGSEWTRGANLSYMRELAGYWLRAYDWRRTEQAINALPNFLADIDGFPVHFLHIKGKQAGSLPLILTHGWPGSFLEMMKLIPLLTEDTERTFDLVIPSLPGYGFSERPAFDGCTVQFIADLWCKLMRGLNYERFGAHGGDFGSGVSMALALRHPEHLIGIHLNNVEGYFKPYVSAEDALSPEERQFEKDAEAWDDTEGAYAHQQRTRPLTLAYGLTDSPVGLCAWIVEKYQRWADCGGDVQSVFTQDELLANVTLYWVTETMHSSIRLYGESRKAPLHFQKNEFVNVPLAMAHFPLEAPFPPRKYVERAFTVQRWTEMPAGGHFAAMEQPALLAADIRTFFGSEPAPTPGPKE